MNKSHIIILVIIVLALIVLISDFFIFDDLKEDVMRYNDTINEISSFNTVNVTMFTSDDDYSDDTYYTAIDTIIQVAFSS